MPYAIYSLAGSFANDIDKYVVNLFCDIDTVAIYANAAKRLPFAILTDSFITVLVPIVTRFISAKRYNEAQKAFKLYLKLGYISTFIIGFGALVLSKHLMCFLYDDKYLPGLPVFNIYIIVEMIRFAGVTILLTSTGKTHIIMINSIVFLLLNVVFDVLSFNFWGVIGPAITTLVLSLINIIVLLLFGAQAIKCRTKDLFDFKQMVVVLLEISIVSVPVYYLANYIESIIHKSSITFLSSFSVYCLLLGLLNLKKILAIISELNEYK